MASTLSPSSLRKPANPDTGATFWDDVAAAIQRLNDHTHSGADSTLLGKTQDILAASWGADLGGGKYRQTVTLAAGLNYDNISIQIRLKTLGHVIYPTIEKINTTSYYCYTNDNSLDFTAVYT
jgi:hypothetical protein